MKKVDRQLICSIDKTGMICFDRNSNSSNSSKHSGGNTSSYPTGGNHDGGGGYSGGSGNFGNSGAGGSSGGTNTYGGLYANSYNYAPGKHAPHISLNSIITQTNNPPHGYLVPEKTINLRRNNLTDSEIGVLVGNLQYQRLDLDVFDVSNNQLGFRGVENLFYGLRFDNPLAGRNIITMNFSNNFIGDDGAKYMADSLVMGRFPHLKHLDISGNNITSIGNETFSQSMPNIGQHIKILFNKILPVDTILSGIKKHSDLLYGSKEEKQAVIKDYLKHAQNNGIDIKNVAVSKSTYDKITNFVSLNGRFIFGFIKCNVVPEDVTSFVAGEITARSSKTAAKVKTYTDFVACYFEAFDESLSSQEGIQHMLDAGIVNTTDLLGNVE